jgi:hypothetical protein
MCMTCINRPSPSNYNLHHQHCGREQMAFHVPKLIISGLYVISLYCGFHMTTYFHLLEAHRYIANYMHNASPFHLLADATVVPAQAYPCPGGAVKRCTGMC